MIASRPLQILLVEDNPGDVRLAQEALLEAAVDHRLQVAEDGVAALELLATGMRPDLVLLDLNLPRKNGLEVLSAIKSAPELRAIPVVVFSSSQADTDVRAAYDLHANTYVTKRADLDEMVTMMGQLAAYWRDVARLPATSVSNRPSARQSRGGR